MNMCGRRSGRLWQRDLDRAAAQLKLATELEQQLPRPASLGNRSTLSSRSASERVDQRVASLGLLSSVVITIDST